MGPEPLRLNVTTLPLFRSLAGAWGAVRRATGRRAAGRLVRSAGLVVWCGLGAGVSTPLAAQQPPDSVGVDTLLVTPDSVLADTVFAQEVSPDTIPADSLAVDTVFYRMPQLRGDRSTGWQPGVWEWDDEDILAVGANTLVELMAEVPGLVPLRGGDYGTPLGLTAFGVGGGGLRIVRDGFEVIPLEGSVPDLSRVGLGGIAHVRLERRMNELVVHLRTRQARSHEPYSLIEVATGDLDTNVFRGTYVDPSAFGGSLGVAIERADTRGPRGDEAGNRTGTWLRYQLHRGDRAGVGVEFRRMGSETEVPLYIDQATRTDWVVRGRSLLAPGLTGEAYWGKSSYDAEDVDTAFAREGGSRSQGGLRLGFERAGLSAEGAYRLFGSDDLPGHRLEVNAGYTEARFGGAAGAWQRSGWDGTSTSNRVVSVWTRPLFGVSVFGSRESGTYGARRAPLLQRVPEAVSDTTDTTAVAAGDGVSGLSEPLPGDLAFSMVDRSATRFGAQWAWRGITLSGARLEVEADSLLPTGLEFDRNGVAAPGGIRKGWEAFGRFPLPMLLEGLYVEGSLQQWEGQGLGADSVLADPTGEIDEPVVGGADEVEPWTYLPERIYRGAFVYRKTLVASGNADLRVHLGVRGRDPMTVRQVVERVEDEETGETEVVFGQVPFYQSWYGTIQLRVVTVRIFIGWENFTVRRNLQDLPGRVLPRTRAVYGIRWTMLN